ncbi:helix-turn-helix transcriptional regulator [Actinoplanes sp. HUAS TT8]|uniref:helix-turn-helix transcriptional regulator n=1 Tax=Actinoplanes sp. HUAS TT8 TaxID=3447453 RepID=UPI003F521EC7
MSRDTGGLPQLMGTGEIGKRLGLSRQRIQQLADTADFPEPFQELGMGRVWLRPEVEAWIEVWRAGAPAVEPGGSVEGITRFVAERVLDCLGERGWAFAGDEHIEPLAGMLRRFLVEAGIEVSGRG